MEQSKILKLKVQDRLQNKNLKTRGALGYISQLPSYILCLRPGSPGPAAALLRSPVILPWSLGLPSWRLAIGWLKLVPGPGAAGKEPSAKAASVGRVSTAFDWNTAWTGYICCFRALRRETESQLSVQGEEKKSQFSPLLLQSHQTLRALRHQRCGGIS